MNLVRVGAIGCGYWGPNLIRNFVEIPGSEVVAIADLQQEAVNRMLERFPQIKTATDTSAAALLSQQQQTVSAEDFAAIQQALTAQNQGPVQVQDQTGKPVVTAEESRDTIRLVLAEKRSAREGRRVELSD